MKTESDMLHAMERYCSVAERCASDVLRKVKEAGLPDRAATRIIESLIQDNFLNIKRFCHSFVNDKLKFNKWGRIKICYELNAKGIKPEQYSEALNAIDETEYETTLAKLLQKKKNTIKGGSEQENIQKLCRFAASRGFEMSIILKTLKCNGDEEALS